MPKDTHTMDHRIQGLKYHEMIRVYRGIDGQRERAIKIWNCKTFDEIKALPWYYEYLPYGRLVPAEQMSTAVPKAKFYSKEIRHNNYGGYDFLGFPLTDPNIINNEVDPEKWDTTNSSLDLYKQGTLTADSVFELPVSFEFKRIAGYVYTNLNRDAHIPCVKNQNNIIGFGETDDYGHENNILTPDIRFYYQDNNDSIKTLSNNDMITDADHPQFAYAYANNSLQWQGDDYKGNKFQSRYIIYLNGQIKPLMYNCKFDMSFNFWVFATDTEAIHYLQTGDYTAALNYGESIAKDYMDLNVPGNSVQTNAVYEFIDPKPGIAYNTPQQIKIDWEVKGAQKNPYTTKTTVFDIPANAHCFVMFDGKSLDLYSSLPGVKLTMGVYNNKKLIASLERTEATLVSHINDLFGIEKPEQRPSGSGMVYNVKIYTPYCFLRQIYNCASRDELPGKGEPTYEIFQPNTSSTHVNPNGTGVKATDHFISFNSIADMKDASDRKLITGGNTNGST